MKKLLSTFIMIHALFGAFEMDLVDAAGRGMGRALTASPVENAFLINPANMRLDTQVFLLLDSSAGNAFLDESFEVGLRWFSKVRINKANAIGIAAEFVNYPYKGSYPGIKKTLWREAQAALAYNFIIRRNFSFGLSGKFLYYDSPFELHGQSTASVMSGDMALGFLYKGDGYFIGVSGDNLIGLNNGSHRIINLGFASKSRDVNTEFSLVLGGDLSYVIDITSFNLKFGGEFHLDKLLILRVGVELNDMLRSGMIPSLSATFKPGAHRLTYTASFNTKLKGPGTHYFSYGVVLGKMLEDEFLKIGKDAGKDDKEAEAKGEDGKPASDKDVNKDQEAKKKKEPKDKKKKEK